VLCCGALVQDELHTQQAFYWQHYRTNRIKEAAGTGSQQAADTQQPVQQPAPQQHPQPPDPMLT
jgi:hypothetical protein